MGTTLDMLQSGSSHYAFVVAIEGYSKLLHSFSSSAAVLTAWAGSDWTDAIRGLSVDLQLKQEMNPSQPFGEMGSCTLWVQKVDGDDSFGVDTHRRAGGIETYLAATIDRDDTTVNVLSSSLFANSGDIHIGTECIGYESKGAGSFLTCTRGKYSPFGTAFSSRFGRDHTVRTDANSVNLQPIVSSIPRTWKGRFAGVWVHRISGGVLDTKEQAELVWAGTLGDIRDDKNTGCTVFEVRSIMEWVGSRVLGDGMLEGRISDGMYLREGMAFSWHEKGQIGGPGGVQIDESTSPQLRVVAGAAGVDEIEPGFYSGSEICSKINAWLAADTNLVGNYSLSTPVTSPDGLRAKIHYDLALDNGSYFRVELPTTVAKFFGWSAVDGTQTPGIVKLDVTTMGVGRIYQDAETEPLRVYAQLNGTSTATIELESTRGEFVDQYARLPTSIRPSSDQIDGVSYRWGIFVIGDSEPMLGAFDVAPLQRTYLTGLQPWIGGLKYRVGTTIRTRFPTIEVPASEAPPRVRQILAYELDFSTLMVTMFLSTGTVGHNSFLDLLPRPLSVGMPNELVGEEFLSEVPGYTETEVVVIEKPTRFSDIVKSSLMFRWAFLVWKGGALRFRSWRAPSAVHSVLDLDDTSKAEPSGNVVSHVTASEQTDEHMRSIVKIDYERSFAEPGEERYKSMVTFYDRVAVEDQGGAVNVHTFKLANTFEEFSATGTSVEALLPQYLAKMPLLSRPAWIVDRSISPALFWQLCIGDVVVFSDPFSRDPSTGQRGVDDRPALLMMLSFRLGGTLPAKGAPTKLPMGGSTRLFFTDVDNSRADAPYAPAANVDAAANPSGFSNGYNASTKTLRTREHDYSNTSDAIDAASFDVGDEVFVRERDPHVPGSPLEWQDTIAGRSGSDLALTIGLAGWDPAKQYVVLFANYGDTHSTQKTHVFQADDATGLIETTTQPYLYGSGNLLPADANDLVEPEFPSTLIHADGAGRCTYGDTQLGRLVDNFIDYKSAQRGSHLLMTAVSNVDVTGTNYKLAAYWPIFLSYEQLNTAAFRYMTCAIWAASTDGTATKARVLLSRKPPISTSLTNVAVDPPWALAEWTGITSTTPTTLVEKTLAIDVKNNFFAGDMAGIAYVVLELGYKAVSRGIAYWAEGARQGA